MLEQYILSVISLLHGTWKFFSGMFGVNLIYEGIAHGKLIQLLFFPGEVNNLVADSSSSNQLRV